MVTNFFITKDGFFRGNGLIPFLTKENGNDEITYNDVFTEIIRDVKRLHDVYVLSMMDDGKITGRERIQLCREIDFLIGDLILVRIILSESNKTFYLSNRQYSVQLTFNINKARWDGFGNMGIVKSLKKKKVKEWISSSYSIKLKRLISYSNMALQDGKIDAHEAEILSSYIEKLLLGLIVARNDIYSAKLS
ncbi:MAG: hypothetical protein JJT78_17830 [Leptospira sp.]|nr:hypothetical protein [Leptospira sp.]